MICDRGYVMIGDDLLRCGFDGIWIGIFLFCDGMMICMFKSYKIYVMYIMDIFGYC